MYRISCLEKVKLILHFLCSEWKKETRRIRNFGDCYSGKGLFRTSVRRWNPDMYLVVLRSPLRQILV